jgi:hypothetical protein
LWRGSGDDFRPFGARPAAMAIVTLVGSTWPSSGVCSAPNHAIEIIKRMQFTDFFWANQVDVEPKRYCPTDRVWRSQSISSCL